MMVTLRLYRQHDLDLITLYKHPNFSLPNAMKTALCAYVRNEKFFIKQPQPYELGKEKISKIVQMHIQLSYSTEQDVIDWLKNIKEGYRNSVLKNVIRSYMAGPCVYSYVNDAENGITQAGSVIDNFESNIRSTIEIKGRSYNRSQTKRPDNRKVEDSKLAKSILSGKGESNKRNVFVERIDDDNVDTKKLEEITKPDKLKVEVPVQRPVEEKPAPKKEIKEQVEQKEEPINKPQTLQQVPVEAPVTEPVISDVEDVEADGLDDMLDDIDAMMNGI